MKMTVETADWSVDASGFWLNFQVKNRDEAQRIVAEIKESDKPYELTVEKQKRKRSLDANAYCWVLCTKLADRLSVTTKIKTTKEDIYRNAVRELGIYRDFPGLGTDEANTLRTAWEMLGTGWITEQVDFEADGNHIRVRCYYGSSTYNTRQMSRLIDNLVQDCKAVGIETLTPAELALLKEAWK